MARSSLFASALAITGVLATPQLAELNHRTINPAEPAEFPPWPPLPSGSNGTNETTVPVHVDSPHFRIFLGSATSEAQAIEGLKPLEAAYDCFVGKLGFKSSGLNQYGTPENGPYYKTESFMVDTLNVGADYEGYTNYDISEGRAWVRIVNGRLDRPSLTVHEYGHVLHWHQGLRNAWPHIPNCQAWNEALANWVADTYLTSGDDVCGPSRAKYNVSGGDSLFEVYKTVGNSHLSIVDAGARDTGNYYQAWPFFTYLFSNPDGYEGLGRDVIPSMLRETPDVGTDETPLHVLQRVLGNSRRVQDVVTRYWARMANGDIGHDTIKKWTLENKRFLNMDNFDASAQNGSYRVKPDRAPQYMGASMAKLVMADGVTRADVNVTAANATMGFTATFAVHDSASGKVRYEMLQDGCGSVDVAAGEDVTLVVVNTPATLLKYNANILNITEAARALDYSVSIAGASIAMF